MDMPPVLRAAKCPLVYLFILTDNAEARDWQTFQLGVKSARYTVINAARRNTTSSMISF